MTRDPRLDPQLGDVLRLTNQVDVVVVMRDSDWVYAHLSNERRVKISLENWQKDCATAEVLYVAD